MTTRLTRGNCTIKVEGAIIQRGNYENGSGSQLANGDLNSSVPWELPQCSHPLNAVNHVKSTGSHDLHQCIFHNQTTLHNDKAKCKKLLYLTFPAQEFIRQVGIRFKVEENKKNKKKFGTGAKETYVICSRDLEDFHSNSETLWIIHIRIQQTPEMLATISRRLTEIQRVNYELMEGVRVVPNVGVPDDLFRDYLVRPFPANEKEYMEKAFSMLYKKFLEISLANAEEEPDGEWADAENGIMLPKNIEAIMKVLRPEFSIFSKENMGQDLIDFLEFNEGAMDYWENSFIRGSPRYFYYKEQGYNRPFNDADVKAFENIVFQMIGQLNPVSELQMRASAEKLFVLCLLCPLVDIFNITYPKDSFFMDYTKEDIPLVEERRTLVLLFHKLSLDRVIHYNIQRNLPVQTFFDM